MEEIQEIERDDRFIYIINNMRYNIFKEPRRNVIENHIHDVSLDTSKFIIRLYKKDLVVISEYNYMIEERKEMEVADFEEAIKIKNNSFIGYLVVDLVVIDNMLEVIKKPINSDTRFDFIKGLNESYLKLLNF